MKAHADVVLRINGSTRQEKGQILLPFYAKVDRCLSDTLVLVEFRPLYVARSGILQVPQTWGFTAWKPAKQTKCLCVNFRASFTYTVLFSKEKVGAVSDALFQGFAYREDFGGLRKRTDVGFLVIPEGT